MKSFETFLEPEVAGLLEEVALGSNTAREAPARMRRFHPLRGTSADGSGLSAPGASAKRAHDHLLEAHRAELEWALRQHCMRATYEDPRWGFGLHRSVTVDRELELAQPDEWKRRARRGIDSEWVSERGEDTSEVASERELLGRCLGTEATPSAASLAAGALRVLPRDEARIYLALALILEQQMGSALGLLNDVLAGSPTDLNASYAWENIGLVHWKCGNHPQALEAYRSASATTEVRATPVANWLLNACILQDEGAARRAAQELDELVPPDHLAIRSFVACHEQEKQLGEWHPSTEAQSFVTQLADVTGPASRRVFDVLR